LSTLGLDPLVTGPNGRSNSTGTVWTSTIGRAPNVTGSATRSINLATRIEDATFVPARALRRAERIGWQHLVFEQTPSGIKINSDYPEAVGPCSSIPTRSCRRSTTPTR
jgi:hypothetical protein